MKWIALLFLLAQQCGCTTPETDQYNPRNLYSPEPEAGSVEAARQMRSRPSPTPLPKPEFR